MELLNIVDPNGEVIPNTWVIYPKLYKVNAHGKILEWHLRRDGARYCTVSGQKDGKTTTSKWTTAKPKNVGKKNATSAEEQADKECLAKYEKKLAQGGYTTAIEDAKEVTFIKPMLAETYYNESTDPETGEVTVKDNRPKDFDKDTYYLQPKLDGVRCLANKDGLFTRQGKDIVGVPHIASNVIDFFERNPEIILDGELYNHTIAFEDIISCVRSEPEEGDGKEEMRHSIKYYIYDIVDTTKTYDERLELLSTWSGTISGHVRTLAAKEVSSLEEISEGHDAFVEAGYEGAMLRKGSGKYKQRRSKDLLKVKEFKDAEFRIVEILEGKGNNAGIAAKIGVEIDGTDWYDDKVIVYPNMTGSWEFCKKVLEEREEYIGGTATVKYFGETQDGSLRFPCIVMLYKQERDV